MKKEEKEFWSLKRLGKVGRALSYIAYPSLVGYLIGMILGLSLWILILLGGVVLTCCAIVVPLGIVERRKMRVEFGEILEEIKGKLTEQEKVEFEKIIKEHFKGTKRVRGK